MDRLFELRYNLPNGFLVIRAYKSDDNEGVPPNHQGIEVEAIWQGRVLFELGEHYCAVKRRTNLRGKEVKKLVSYMVGMNPKDIQLVYYNNATDDQFKWAHRNGEHLEMEADERYGYE